MMNRKIKPLAAAVGVAFAASLANANIADTNSDPFVAKALDQGYVLLAKSHSEGKCGEGKCGEGEGKAGEGKCGESNGDGEGKAGEGKCGEGKCGEGKERKG